MIVPVSSLHHHPFNAEIYTLSDLNTLTNSINEVGLLEPLVINKKNEVISGNRRLEAVRKLKIEDVEVVVRDIKKEDEPLIIISHNSQRIKTARELLNEIKVLYKYYSVGRGYRSDTFVNTNKSNARKSVSDELGISEMKIQRLLFIDRIFPELIDLIDDGKLTINQAYIEAKRRNVYQSIKDNNDQPGIPTIVNSETYTIYNKSSEQMNELDDCSVNMIMTSPPYFSQRNYGNDRQIGLENSIDVYVDNLMKVFNECKRVLRDDGSLWVVIGDTFVNGCLSSVPHRLAISLIENGWIQRNCIVWHKTNPKPESVKTRLSTSHEFIFFFTKSLNYYFDIDSVRQPYKDKPFNDVRSPRHHSLNGNPQIHTPVIQNPLGKVPQDFIETSKHSFGIGKKLGIDDIEHGAVYPPSICHLPIKSSTKKNDIVLDCFSGSGTTGRVALELGRKYIGYEINSKFVHLTELRLSSYLEKSKTRLNGKMEKRID